MKKLLSLIIAIAIVITTFAGLSINFTVSAATYGDLTYKVLNGEATITDCNESASGALEIPATIEGYPVTSIGSYAFYYCDGLTSVTIPDSVTSIGDEAFCFCTGLIEVHITDIAAWCNVSFSSGRSNPLCYATNLYLNGTKVTNLVISEGVTSIGGYAFYGCRSLTSITIPDSVTSIGSYAFSGCRSFTSVTIPDSVTSIGGGAFRYCTGLTSVTIPDSVTSIGDYAFANCDGLTSVTIPDSVTSIGSYAFSECTGLTSITIPDSVTSIGSSAFRSCTGLTSVTIGNSVTSIGDYAFSGCRSLTSITIPDSVTSIGSYAFSECTGLTSITIPDSVTSIGNGAFWSCTGLTSVTIPDSVASIGDYAFEDCTGLTSITIPDSVTIIGGSAFEDCDGLISVTIPDSVTSIGYRAFYGCSSLTSITIPDSVTRIYGFAFYACYELKEAHITDLAAWCNVSFSSSDSNPLCYAKNLYLNGTKVTNLVIPEGVTSIGSYAFSECTGLTSITIPDSVTSIGSYAFSGCTGLTSITIPDSVTSMGGYAFYNTADYNNDDNWQNGGFYIGNHLLAITKSSIAGKFAIKTGTKIIASGLFYDCDGLTSVTIPDSVTSIGSSAFSCCSGLTSITIPDSVTSIGFSAFDSCTGLTSVTIGNGVTSIGSYTFAYCRSLTNLTIGSSVKSIGVFAFDGCSRLTSVTIPSSVTTIGDFAFEDCSSLTSVTIPNSVTTIGFCAFEKCSKLQTVYYIGTEEQWNNRIGNNHLLTAERIYISATIKGADLEIGSTLTVNYFVESDADLSKLTMRFTVSGTKVVNVTGVLDEKTGYYKFAYTDINPQCMNDDIKAELLFGETVIDSKESYSVKAYCENQLKRTKKELGFTTQQQYEAYRKLLADMLVYGSEAQKYMDYKVQNLPDTETWVQEYKSEFTVPTGVKTITGNQDINNCIKSASLNMSNVNKIYFRLILTDENVKVLLNDVEVDKSELLLQDDGTYLFYTEGLRATEFDKVFTLTLLDGQNNELSKVEYNVNAFIQSKHQSQSIGQIVQALNNYGKSAQEYKEALVNDNSGDFDLGDEDSLM